MTTGILLQIQENATNLVTSVDGEGEITLPIIDLVLKGGVDYGCYRTPVHNSILHFH